MNRCVVWLGNSRWVSLVIASLIPALSQTIAAPAAVTPFAQHDLAAFDHVLADPTVARERVWTLREGVLACTGAPLGVLYTREAYTDVRIELEYRWAPGTKPGNSGIMARLSPKTGALPRTLEVQLQHGNAGDVIGLKGFSIAESRQARWFERDSAVAGKVTGVKKAHAAERAPGEWNRLAIELRGGRCTVDINGQRVNDVSGIETSPGPIGLQSEGGEIHFRGLRIQPL